MTQRKIQSRLNLLSVSALEGYRDEYSSRIETIARLKVLRDGLPPSGDDSAMSRALWDYNVANFAADNLIRSEWSSLNPDCRRFIELDQNAHHALQTLLEDLPRAEDGYVRAVLEARAKILSALASSLFQLVRNDAEAGMDAFGSGGKSCGMVNGVRWKSALTKRYQQAVLATTVALGVQGLRNANSLSVELSRLYVDRVDYEFGSRVFAKTFEIGLSLGLGTMVFSRLVMFLRLQGLAAPTALRLSAAIGAVGSGMTAIEVSDQWALSKPEFHQLLSAREELLALTQWVLMQDHRSAKRYLDLLISLERNYSRQVLAELEAARGESDAILRRWGSLTRALTYNQERLLLIEAELASRLTGDKSLVTAKD